MLSVELPDKESFNFLPRNSLFEVEGLESWNWLGILVRSCLICQKIQIQKYSNSSMMMNLIPS
jgi:hypothetical protein